MLDNTCPYVQHTMDLLRSAPKKTGSKVQFDLKKPSSA